MMHRHDAPPEPPSSSTLFGARRLPFDVDDVAVVGIMILLGWILVFAVGILVGTFAAGVVVAFRALT